MEQNKTILHLDADAFFASVEQGFNPLLAERPVIVGGLPHQRGCVHTASYEARRNGVVTGMSLRQAQELCPDAVFLKGDYRRYRAAGLTIEEIIGRHTPDVEVSSIDDLYADLTYVQRGKKPIDIARSIQRLIRDNVKIGVSIGIASTKLVARIASGLNKPEGITVVPYGKEQEFLRVLPVRMLRGIGSKTEKVLNEIGILSVNDFLKLPKHAAMNLLGQAAGGSLWKFARGLDERQVLQRTVPGQLSRETSFAEDTDDQRLVEGTFRYLTERIAAKLRKNGWTAKSVHVKVYYADGQSRKKSKTMRERSSDTRQIVQYVMDIFRSFNTRRVRIKLVGISLTGIAYVDEQAGIFDIIERRDELNRGIDSVRDRFGFTSLETGSTMKLQEYYRMEKHGYRLHTPSLSQ